MRMPRDVGARDAGRHAQIFEGSCGIVALVFDGQMNRAGPPARAPCSHQRRGPFGERNDARAGLHKGNQLAEAPHSAAVDRFAAQPALVPGVAELLGIELIEIVFHIEQAAAERAGVSVLLGSPAGAGRFPQCTGDRQRTCEFSRSQHAVIILQHLPSYRCDSPCRGADCLELELLVNGLYGLLHVWRPYGK